MGFDKETRNFECGCCTTTHDHDSFNYSYESTFLCPVHQQQENERQLAREKKKQEAKQPWTEYVRQLEQIEHKTNTPIKHAICKFRPSLNIYNSDQWLFKNILLRDFEHALMIQKVKNKWVCSEERLEAIDFNEYNRDDLYH